MYGVDDTVRQSQLISSVPCTGAAFKFPIKESFQAIIGQWYTQWCPSTQYLLVYDKLCGENCSKKYTLLIIWH